MVIIRRRPAPKAPEAEAPVAAAPAPEVRKGPVKRLVVPIVPITYTPPVPLTNEERERNDDGIDYVATIKRYAAKVKNPLTAIRAHCVHCSGGSLKEVSNCKIATCSLHPFRMGVNMMHKKTRDRLAREAGGSNGGDDVSDDGGEE